MNPKSGRTIPLYFKVSPEEKELIDKKMEQLGTSQPAGVSSQDGGGRLRCPG